MRFVGVKCNVRGRDLGGFVAEAQRRVAADVQLPPNSFLTWGGEFENQRRAMARLAIIVPVSIGLILAILVRTFGSFACALLILATIPFALVGGVVGLDVAGLNLSVSACIGFIALMGQVVLNGVVLVSQINALRAEGMRLGGAGGAGATRRPERFRGAAPPAGPGGPAGRTLPVAALCMHGVPSPLPVLRRPVRPR